MLLSTKGDYGVRALIDLAKHVGEGPVATCRDREAAAHS